MKRELHPAVVGTIIAVLVIVIVAAFFVSNNAGGQKVDLKTIDPKDLRDEEPVRRGQPGYRERITDPVTK